VIAGSDLLDRLLRPVGHPDRGPGRKALVEQYGADALQQRRDLVASLRERLHRRHGDLPDREREARVERGSVSSDSPDPVDAGAAEGADPLLHEVVRMDEDEARLSARGDRGGAEDGLPSSAR
jgi:hypothetical protein